LPQKLPEQKSSVKKPTVRAKVPFEKGYSQMDWLKLTRTHPDLAGIVILLTIFKKKIKNSFRYLVRPMLFMTAKGPPWQMAWLIFVNRP
jgi:hypothetical protein